MQINLLQQSAANLQHVVWAIFAKSWGRKNALPNALFSFLKIYQRKWNKLKTGQSWRILSSTWSEYFGTPKEGIPRKFQNIWVPQNHHTESSVGVSFCNSKSVWFFLKPSGAIHLSDAKKVWWSVVRVSHKYVKNFSSPRKISWGAIWSFLKILVSKNYAQREYHQFCQNKF